MDSAQDYAWLILRASGFVLEISEWLAHSRSLAHRNLDRRTPPSDRVRHWNTWSAPDVSARNKPTVKCQTACKPGSVRKAPGQAGGPRGTTIPLGRALQRASRDQPGWRDGNVPEHPRSDRQMAPPPLFGLAPGGVYPAAAVTGGAVRSYRTVSPLPVRYSPRNISRAGIARAVCFLWHFPWGHPRRPLAGTVFPWSPDFPPSPGPAGGQRPSGRLTEGTWGFAGGNVKPAGLWVTGRN
jgi:hypothetical protein